MWPVQDLPVVLTERVINRLQEWDGEEDEEGVKEGTCFLHRINPKHAMEKSIPPGKQSPQLPSSVQLPAKVKDTEHVPACSEAKHALQLPELSISSREV